MTHPSREKSEAIERELRSLATLQAQEEDTGIERELLRSARARAIVERLAHATFDSLPDVVLEARAWASEAAHDDEVETEPKPKKRGKKVV